MWKRHFAGQSARKVCEALLAENCVRGADVEELVRKKRQAAVQQARRCELSTTESKFALNEIAAIVH